MLSAKPYSRRSTPELGKYTILLVEFVVEDYKRLSKKKEQKAKNKATIFPQVIIKRGGKNGIYIQPLF
jgi:hypothetical protein